MDFKIEESWRNILAEEFDKDYFVKLTAFVKQEYASHTIFPPASKIFAAFDLCTFDNVKVVILGQDPYHGLGQAHGLCFSVNQGIKFPPSLINIFKELRNDLGCEIPLSGNLSKWGQQGVLLLNATLTVRQANAGSHQNKGWETFTDSVIQTISQRKDKVVFILWGNYAIKKSDLIDKSKHHILTTVHPSPLSAHRGFFGCRHFSKTNTFLQQNGLTPIDWQL